MTILIIIAMWLGGWLGAGILVAVIHYFCTSPRRFERHRQKYPLPSGSIDREVHQ